MYFYADARNVNPRRASNISSIGSTKKKIASNSRTKFSSYSCNNNSTDFMSRIVGRSSEGRSTIIIPANKSESINVDNYIANII